TARMMSATSSRGPMSKNTVQLPQIRPRPVRPQSRYPPGPPGRESATRTTAVARGAVPTAARAPSRAPSRASRPGRRSEHDLHRPLPAAAFDRQLQPVAGPVAADLHDQLLAAPDRCAVHLRDDVPLL